MASLLRFLGMGPKNIEVAKATMLRTSFRLGKKSSWPAFQKQAAPAFTELAAATSSPAPQVIVQIVSELEGNVFLVLPPGAGAKSANDVLQANPAYAQVMSEHACGALTYTQLPSYVWTWGASLKNGADATLTTTSFEIHEGSFDDFVDQFASNSHQMRQDAEECSILWQAVLAPDAEDEGKVQLLSLFSKGVDGPKRMAPKLLPHYEKMGLASFMTAKPLIDTNAHGSYLTPIDSDACVFTSDK